MKTRAIFRTTQISLALAGAFGALPLAQAANTDIATEPLTQAATGVRPNIMFILDDSGSMDWDFSPDHVDDVQPSGATPNTTAACFDGGDTGPTGITYSQDFDDSAGSITGRPDHCIAGDPPFMSPDFNKQYYNPAIWYRPGVNDDGIDRTNMNAANTSNWTTVPTDPYGQQEDNQRGQTSSNENLVANYPDRAWCKNTGDAATDTTNCRVNSAYTYPNWEYNRGFDNSNGYVSDYANVKFRYGTPYYYRMQSAQWCSTATLDAGTCVSGSTVDPNVHSYIAPEFCTDAELVNCAAGAALTPAHVFSGARWCSDQSTLLSCQRKKIGNFRWPKHLGVTQTRTVNIPARSATGTVTVTQSALNEELTTLSVGGVSIIGGTIVAAGSSTSALATAIRDAINTHVSTPEYTAIVAGSTVTITAAATGAGENGKTIVVASTQTGTASATGTVRVNDGGSGDQYVEQILVDHPTLGSIDIMSNSCTATALGSNISVVGGGDGNRLFADSGTNSNAERNALAEGIMRCINEATGSTGFSAARTGNEVTITAPIALGVTINNRGISVVQSDGSFTTNAFNGGESTGVVVSTPGSLAGGADPTTGSLPVRLGVGQFSRVTIESSNNNYPKAFGRIDCAGSTCTYAEEMTNFANWYAYYRTRMQMMKTAAGRAFVPIDDTYRVGFITINPGSPVAATQYLRIQNFDAGHKAAWYTKFYGQSVGGGTPLREALSRVGRLYGGKFDGINSGIPAADDPMEVSCQPNFAILSSDGYWNGNSGNNLSGNNLGQQDNSNVGPYSLQSEGVYDGGDDNTVGLADVALYYYMTDLRPTGATNAAGVNVSPDNVPTTQKDFAAHQHMTTFTLGLGLDGTLSYRSDYESANTGDFHAIRQGTLTGSWPNPAADSPSALDDLWHAAVNGRGVFFSASNPQELAASLTDTLNALKQRVGAGAAAATSNLQPVAGDNFAFTAQYQTQVWIGDLKARTIDLNSGAISFIELWSAQSLLNGRAHTSRAIYTRDALDAYNSTSTGAIGNGLKHFCDPADIGATWCVDGTGLGATELLYFDPSKLTQFGGFTATQLPNATAQNLVNYLRGEQSFENQGLLQPTDLFRERAALLGDIINAQPTYVKASPFNYTDSGYQEFKACTDGTAAAASVTCPSAQFASSSQVRRPTVFIASNDGMLHAIETDVNNDPYYQTAGISTPETGDDSYSSGSNAGNGVERWAYMPSLILPEVYKLASNPYIHRYFVDGSPTASDICISTPCAGLSDWRTIVVAGLNSGGRGFYALDITNPTNPRAMWEFTVRKPSVTACAATPGDAVGESDDCDLGLSFGNPVITKLKSTGKWVVIVTSGLNNTGLEPSGTLRQGDGMGYLYVLDALTGTILHKIPTGVGDPGTSAASYTDADPSGLAKINNWVNSASTDNTTLAVYGGDMKGNLWRFDLDSASATYLTAVKVAVLKDAFGTAQPVTTRPELGLISNRRVIFLGTGRFLGVTDKANTAKQSVYAIADDLSGNTTMTARLTDLVQQTITNVDSTTRTVSAASAVDWTNAAVRGWFVDLPDKGERVSVDPQLQLGTLVVPSNVPSNDTCVAGGTAWINTFDFKTGSFVAGATGNAVSQKVTGSVVVGINVIQLPGGKVVTVVTTADNQQRAVETPVAPTNFQGKRVGWRELSADQ
jgi:type IV pilus assembly protein PilY1